MSFTQAATVKFYNGTAASNLSASDWARMPYGMNIFLGSGYINGSTNTTPVQVTAVDNPSKIIIGAETSAESGKYGMCVLGNWQAYTMWTEHAAINGFMSTPHNGGSQANYGGGGACNSVFVDGHAATNNNARTTITSSWLRWK